MDDAETKYKSYGEFISRNFTPHAQKVLGLAREEALRFNRDSIGTAHLLLGLIKLGQGVVVTVLAKLGLDLETVRKEVKRQGGACWDPKLPVNICYTPRVKRVLVFAANEARRLNHAYVGTEHFLIGLLHELEGGAARVFQNLGIDAEKVLREILRELERKEPGSAVTA